jgi:hypothetical protein
MAPSRPGSPAAEFVARLREQPIDLRALARFLDGLAPVERVAAIRAAGRAEQRRLYAAAEGFAELRLRDLVPPATPDLATVRHCGRNTLPLFTRFEKRFCRPAGADAEKPECLWGYNFQSLSPLTGPGSYVARQDPARPEVWIDYREIPPATPPGWPTPRPNQRGLARLVYGSMVDTLRRVSEHATIGSAARNGRELGSWFLLCRED